LTLLLAGLVFEGIEQALCQMCTFLMSI
jgi:hypothetical protein